MKKFLKQYEPLLGANDYSFLERVYSTDPEIYRNRIRAIAFEGKERVLDAGCGFGQWTNVFAKLNQEVHACDISGIRLAICRDMASYFGHRNVFVRHSSLEKTPYESEFF
ncbi:MAG: class I SAM-dependent methyltransferase, partial [Bacteroidota bacterium]